MGDYNVFISACEASAEKHCLELMGSMKTKAAAGGNSIKFSGLGGKAMQQAGCEILADTVSKAAMIYNVFGQIGYYYKLIKKVRKFLKDNPQDLVIVCDSPAFNFHIAKAAKKSGQKVLFYVAPQLWAWAPWRLGKLKRCCDKLACILPFEANWFTSRGLEAEFVGNPLFDEVDIDIKENIRTNDNYSPEKATVALLPGSRDAEIDTLWQPMQQIALRLKHKYNGIRFVAVAPNSDKQQRLHSLQIEGFDCDYQTDTVINTCRKVDYTFVASGSATLQVAAAASPMTIMYQSNKYLWHIVGRWLIRIKYLSLVNILAGKELVPEYMPYFNSIDPIASQAIELIASGNELSNTSRQLAQLVSPLIQQKTKDRVAEIAVDMCEGGKA